MHQKTQNHFLQFSIHLSVRKSRENCRQIYGKSKASLWGNLSTGTPQFFLGQSFASQLQFTIDILFRTAVLRKLLDIGFSYKHCNFSHVTRSISKDREQCFHIVQLAQNFGGVIKRRICHEEKLVMGVVRQTANSSEFLTYIGIR